MLYKLWAIKLHNFTGHKERPQYFKSKYNKLYDKTYWLGSTWSLIIKLLGDCTIVYNGHFKTKTHIWII